MTQLNQKSHFYFILYLLLLVCNFSTFAAAPSKSTKKTEKALLWEISGNGLSAPSYLFGTIHMICPEDFVLGTTVKNKLKQSKQLVLEIDMDDPEMYAAIQQAMVAPGSSLRSLYTEAEYKIMSDFFRQKLEVDLAMLDQMKPYAITLLLTQTYLNCQPESYEQHFFKLAKEQGKPVLGIETIEQQLGFFDKLSPNEQAKMALEAVQDIEKNKQEFLELVQHYKNQDLAELEKMTQEAYKKHPKLLDILYKDRNRAWIPVVEKTAKDNATFFAVGAAHLPGKDGLIELLRAKGYKVKPVK